ncbi:MAG: class I SAM-dependent methyltransferase [Bacteroidales bacterium]|nr:class I SAM-dependent methyltransferase [Bacteroidales bacterium]
MKLFQAYKYLLFLIQARNRKGHGVHSPFVFNLISNHLLDNTPYYCFEKIELLRRNLEESNKVLKVKDLGAGSVKMKKPERKVSEIAKNSGSPAKYGETLFKLTNITKPKTILELGTSLGLGTAYMASYSKFVKVISIEGCPETANIAKSNLMSLGLTNVEIMTGDFSKNLPNAIEKLHSLDFVFFDGNHRKKASLEYFNFCLNFAGENSVFVFDDIYWSKEMCKAWKEIKKNEKVSCTIDLFRMGIVFFRKDLPKQNIKLLI